MPSFCLPIGRAFPLPPTKRFTTSPPPNLNPFVEETLEQLSKTQRSFHRLSFVQQSIIKLEILDAARHIRLCCAKESRKRKREKCHFHLFRPLQSTPSPNRKTFSFDKATHLATLTKDRSIAETLSDRKTLDESIDKPRKKVSFFSFRLSVVMQRRGGDAGDKGVAGFAAY